MSTKDSFLADIPNNEYEVFFGKKIFNKFSNEIKKKTSNKDILIISDSCFKTSYSKSLSKNLKKEGFNPILFFTDAGKVNKTFNEVLNIYGILEENNFARDATIIAIGGGTVGDMAGFVASTWYRGMNLVHVPTTMMAMVDSCLGGKVAVNFRESINAIGNYYHPLFIVIDLHFLYSLSKRDYISGLSEIIKCALISESDLFSYLKSNLKLIKKDSLKKNIEIIRSTLLIKLEHVKNDVFESNKRLFLNYGHTFGHPIEAATQQNNIERVRHGEAVALGIIASLHASNLIFGLSLKFIEEVKEIMKYLEIPCFIKAKSVGYDRETLIEKCISLVKKDKKRTSNKVRFILIKEQGKPLIFSDLSSEQLKSCYQQVIR
jgi:3-dehydroquinate synthase|tara:strand:- start:3925 stop:5052 length:1128 start_codon:yes stop_codon:yes gene_type:complete